MSLSENKDGVILDIYVKPNSPKFEITFESQEILVHCTEEPEKGKVNKEIIKEFTKRFHKKTEIISGLTSRQKKLLITGATKSEVAQILGINLG
jgi:uncharacterized protein (TIGR00251 family)